MRVKQKCNVSHTVYTKDISMVESYKDELIGMWKPKSTANWADFQ